MKIYEAIIKLDPIINEKLNELKNIFGIEDGKSISLMNPEDKEYLKELNKKLKITKANKLKLFNLDLKNLTDFIEINKVIGKLNARFKKGLKSGYLNPTVKEKYKDNFVKTGFYIKNEEQFLKNKELLKEFLKNSKNDYKIQKNLIDMFKNGIYDFSENIYLLTKEEIRNLFKEYGYEVIEKIVELEEAKITLSIDINEYDKNIEQVKNTIDNRKSGLINDIEEKVISSIEVFENLKDVSEINDYLNKIFSKVEKQIKDNIKDIKEDLIKTKLGNEIIKINELLESEKNEIQNNGLIEITYGNLKIKEKIKKLDKIILLKYKLDGINIKEIKTELEEKLEIPKEKINYLEKEYNNNEISKDQINVIDNKDYIEIIVSEEIISLLPLTSKVNGFNKLLNLETYTDLKNKIINLLSKKIEETGTMLDLTKLKILFSDSFLIKGNEEIIRKLEKENLILYKYDFKL